MLHSYSIRIIVHLSVLHTFCNGQIVEESLRTGGSFPELSASFTATYTTWKLIVIVHEIIEALW